MTGGNDFACDVLDEYVKYGGSLVKIKGRDYNGWQRCQKGCSDKKTAGL